MHLHAKYNSLFSFKVTVSLTVLGITASDHIKNILLHLGKLVISEPPYSKSPQIMGASSRQISQLLSTETKPLPWKETKGK